MAVVTILGGGDEHITLLDISVAGYQIESLLYVKSYFELQPERINPETGNQGYDIRSDVWSLGISLVSVCNNNPTASCCRDEKKKEQK